ncbi:hypothetical protein GOP47_0013734 [Adiantum capillus-veneris]|uniref:Omega-3 fatty acid desaturase n=1 Tax=Adiantum capillus-veneris TaxID=13818 RepID=A0A9D4ZDI1_ADICA|nr:hypothetical protein GOP47_0013734 [Adiantum capillus-veneris]
MEKPFDPSAAPPFTLRELRDAIPLHCFVKSTPLALSYFFRDVVLIEVLMFFAAALDRHTLLHWPFYWLLQGTIFWSLFVLGHDCGHGSFSENKCVNHLVGHMAHTFVLVPYHGWRISHRNHHQNHGHADKDESWHPVPEKLYREMDSKEKIFRYTPLALLAYPIYLWTRSPGKHGSHFHPDSPLFKKVERKVVLTSTIWWICMLSGLVLLSCVFGSMWILKLYFVPYLISVVWLDGVTYLQHHGYKEKVPWYRGKEWSNIRGGLSTIDRDFGVLNNLMHSVGTHVVHHLFPQIPHYHLVEANEAIKSILGKYYREPKKSGVLPVHLIKQVLTSLQEDHYVDDEGDVIFYKSDKRH